MSCDKNNRLSRLFFCLYAYNVVAITILLKNTNTTEKTRGLKIDLIFRCRWGKMIAIGVGISVTFIVLALLYIYLFWCKRGTVPFLDRLFDRAKAKYYAAEDAMP